ncbi:MAG: CAP domain-containing protein, partial [bacterium]|nr:CAP domain-containing protein [bacterium]
DSKTGPVFVNIGQQFEFQIKRVFSEAISESVNFLTVKPRSDDVVQLDFKIKSAQLKIDATSEDKMIELVNNERVKRGIDPLKMDEQLTELGRLYAKEMFERGFFSHISQVDGFTPGDRADRMNIEYMVLGENLAYAPDVYLSHQGLMNSEGHRKNILSEDFGRVGIGVIDGGVYGKMFVQEFAN